MIFMSDLDCFALTNFAEMAQFGSQRDFNLVVELGRNEGHDCPVPAWAGVRRFLVQPGSNAEGGINVTGKDADMDDPHSIASFVRWATTTYPAKHYGFVYWDHGQGYARPLKLLLNQPGSSRFQPGGYNSIKKSLHEVLYNRDLADALRDALGGRMLDFLGFDACYMGGLENAYAFHDVARYLVASETKIPYEGWNYAIWQRDLRQAGIGIDGLSMSQTLVNAYYSTHYGYDTVSDLAALDLGQATHIADLVSKLAESLQSRLTNLAVLQAIGTARNAAATYGPLDPGDVIDLRSFVEALKAHTSDPEIAAAATAFMSAFDSFVVAAQDLQPGDQGASIFFPDSLTTWTQDDPDGWAYLRPGACIAGGAHQIKFVCNPKQHWPDFLKDYLSATAGYPTPDAHLSRRKNKRGSK